MLRNLLILLTFSLVGAASVLAAKFDHVAHNEYVEGSPCSACHVAGAPSIVPDFKLCQDCHDEDFLKEVELPGLNTHGPVWPINHRAAAKGNTPDCSACHQQSDCLDCHKAGFADEMGALGNQMMNVHRSDFHISHPIAARTNPQLCSSCHESQFCNDCHSDFRFRTGRSSGASHNRIFDLIPSDDPARFAQVHQGFTFADPAQANCDNCHTNSTPPDFHAWSNGHGREARKNLATCQACHPEGDTCLRCHSARAGSAGQFNPHGSDWGSRKNRLRDATDGKTCRKCHDGF